MRWGEKLKEPLSWGQGKDLPFYEIKEKVYYISNWVLDTYAIISMHIML